MQGRSKGLAKDGFFEGSFCGVVSLLATKGHGDRLVDGLSGGCKVCG